MSRKRPQEEYYSSLAYRFRRWMNGEKDPFVGTLEMKPPVPLEDPEQIYEPSDSEESTLVMRD